MSCMSVSLISELWNSGRLCEGMQAADREPDSVAL